MYLKESWVWVWVQGGGGGQAGWEGGRDRGMEKEGWSERGMSERMSG